MKELYLSGNSTQKEFVSQRLMQNFILRDLEMPLRLTKWLQNSFKVSYAYAQQMIRRSAIRINGKKIKSDCKISNGDAVAVYSKVIQKKIEDSLDPRFPRLREDGDDKERSKFVRENRNHQDNCPQTVAPFLSSTHSHLSHRHSPLSSPLSPLSSPLSPLSSPRRRGSSATALKALNLLKDRILFKDNNILAIDKPGGLATQGGSGIKVSVDDLLDEFKFESKIRPRLVHRLDKDTSGVLLLARTKEAAISLAAQFKQNSIRKKYLALVVGKIFPPAGAVEAEISKDGGPMKPAKTQYKVISHHDGKSLVEFVPLTGRTHQIRIHSAKFLNAPILGDTKHGGKIAVSSTKRLYLHAHEIKIKDLLGKSYHIVAAVPDYFD